MYRHLLVNGRVMLAARLFRQQWQRGLLCALLLCAVVALHRWLHVTSRDMHGRPTLRKHYLTQILKATLRKSREDTNVNFSHIPDTFDYLLDKTGRGQHRGNKLVLFADSPHPLAKLGNKLFMFASSFGMAQSMHRKLYITSSLLWIHAIFKVKAGVRDANPYDSVVFTADYATYDPSYYDLHTDLDLVTLSYLQSWKYFYHSQRALRKELVFRAKYLDPAYEFVRGVMDEAAAMYRSRTVTLIGVHVRRMDMLVDENIYQGYRTAPLSYFVRAMLHYASKYSNVHFVVTSDDIPWARNNLPQHYDSISFCEGRDSPVDLAVLSLCNHTIGSVGTFSWWAAWLAGGDVVMYERPVQEGSRLHMEGFVQQDFFPPTWNLLT